MRALTYCARDDVGGASHSSQDLVIGLIFHRNTHTIMMIHETHELHGSHSIFHCSSSCRSTPRVKIASKAHPASFKAGFQNPRNDGHQINEQRGPCDEIALDLGPAKFFFALLLASAGLCELFEKV